jgi:uncharacterized CHY-type Zn-finger protein
MRIHNPSGIEVIGIEVQSDTRCAHYHSPRDVIAIRFKCCDHYYPCYECHREVAGHLARQWPEAEFDREAVLCGACGSEMTISEYLGCNSICPGCQAEFNPNCALHYHLYFESPEKPNKSE